MPGVFVEMDAARPSDEELDLKTRLSSLFLSDSMSDVDFLVGELPHRCPCHKLVLGLGSKVFEAMFYGKMAEKDEVRAPDVTRTGFTIMLRHLYSGTICIRSQSEAFETAYVSQKYLIDPLFRACEAYLVRHATLDPESVFSIYEEATFLDMKRLRGRCMRYVSRNARKVMTSESFFLSSKKTLEDILTLDLMDIDSEVEIIEALWRWGEERCKERDIESSAENIRNSTRGLLKHVRFLSLAKKDLERALERFQLLDGEEELAVLWNAAMPRSVGATPGIPPSLCDVSRTRSVTNCSKLELPTEYRYDGSLTVFSIAKHQTTVQVTVSGPQVTILGAVLAFKPIPCYSPVHRSLDFELRVGNVSTRNRSRVRLSSRAESSVEDESERLERERIENFSTRHRSRARFSSRSESSEEDESESCLWSERLEREILLEDFVAISDGETANLSVEMAAEGVRLMQCVESEFTSRCGDALVTFRFEGVERTMFPIKELIKGNGLYAHPSDCTRYFACSDGMSQERGCPEGFKFDSLRHCTPNEDADCGRRQIRAESAEAVICPSYYGYFPYAEDCHKFVVCVEGLPTVHNCPEGQHYDDNVGCVDGAVCPQIQAEESTVCRKADSLYPHDNCLRYYKCVNFKPQSKGCSRGKAFDPKKSACKREQFSKCKRNDVQDIMRSDY